MKYWLMKSEPDVFGIDDLERERVTNWEGVRNYQARNFMRDDMRKGDLSLFYHSNVSSPGIVGIMRVVREAYPDETAEDRGSPYYDARACRAERKNPWVKVDLVFEARFRTVVALAQLRKDPELASLLVIRKGMRLSVQPVEKGHFVHICRLAGVKIPA
jgi:predicted RNA-binding protein with PUA-like domain